MINPSILNNDDPEWRRLYAENPAKAEEMRATVIAETNAANGFPGGWPYQRRVVRAEFDTQHGLIEMTKGDCSHLNLLPRKHRLQMAWKMIGAGWRLLWGRM